MTVAELPEVLRVPDVAEFFRVSKITIYRNPKKYGGKKIRGKGTWIFPKETVLNLAGISQEYRKKNPCG